METDSIISIKNLNKSFSNNSIVIFQDLNVEIPRNKIVGLIGANGSGKTTFIKLLSGMITPDKGEIFINNIDVRNQFYNAKKIISVMSDANRSLYWNLSGQENLEYFAVLRGITEKKQRTKIVKELISTLNMESYILKKVESYSKGMKQKLMFLIALLNNPKLLILDEPLNGLDFENILLLKDVLFKSVQNGLSVLITSHDKYFLEEVCDIKYIINNKKLILAESTEPVSKELKVYFKVLNHKVLGLLQEYYYEVVDEMKCIYFVKVMINNYNFLSLISKLIEYKDLELLSVVN